MSANPCVMLVCLSGCKYVGIDRPKYVRDICVLEFAYVRHPSTDLYKKMECACLCVISVCVCVCLCVCVCMCVCVNRSVQEDGVARGARRRHSRASPPEEIPQMVPLSLCLSVSQSLSLSLPLSLSHSVVLSLSHQSTRTCKFLPTGKTCQRAHKKP